MSFAAAVLSALLFVPVTHGRQNATGPTGTIQGIITRSDSGDPIAGVRVSLAGGAAGAQAMQKLLTFAASQGLSIPAPPPGTSDDQIMQSLLDAAIQRGVPIGRADIQGALDSIGGATFPTTTTDPSGKFVFGNIAPGRYTLRAERNGFFGKSIEGPNAMALMDANVNAGQTISVTAAMTPTAVISGHVRDAAGKPMSNVDVQAYRVYYQGGMPLLDPVNSRATDDLGEFRLIWVLPGEYYVGVTPRPPSAASIAARNPQEVATFFPQATDTSAAIPVTLRAGEEVSGIDIGVRKVRPFHVTGRVNSSVPPPPVSPDAQGVFVAINQQQNNSATIFIVSRNSGSAELQQLNSVASVVLNAGSGTFDIPNILPGAYDLYARVNDKDGPAFGHAEVDVVNQDVSGLTINIQSSVNVRGTLVVTSANRTPVSMDAWRVTLEPEGNIAKMGFGMRAGPIGARMSTVARDGSYRIQNVPPGHYRILMAGLPVGLYVDDVLQNGTSVMDSGFDVGRDEPTPVQIAVKSGAGLVEGTAAPGAAVAMVPTGRRENHALYFGATADAAGAFTIRGIVPGEYKIFAWETIPPGAYVNSEFLKKYEDSGTAVTVLPDSRLRLAPTIIK